MLLSRALELRRPLTRCPRRSNSKGQEGNALTDVSNSKIIGPTMWQVSHSACWETIVFLSQSGSLGARGCTYPSVSVCEIHIDGYELCTVMERRTDSP